ncbi:MAG TPA: hypothetical protein VFB52_08240 [Solirubrobacterales bacterium]|nr:hypothetical protein [Solirubrobacterales bacterium]
MASALVASACAAAQAQAIHYEATNPPGTLSGSANAGEELITEAGSVYCEGPSLSEACKNGPFHSLSLHPPFTHCDIECDSRLESIKVTASTCSMEIRDAAANSSFTQATILHGGESLLFSPKSPTSPPTTASSARSAAKAKTRAANTNRAERLRSSPRPARTTSSR